MKMYEVKTQEDKRAFLDFAAEIYKEDANWIRPLDKDIEDIFDTHKNKTFNNGECTRWLLKNDSSKVIGRIAAFVNNTYKQEQPTGGIGYFECINSQEAANFMFDHCKKWLHQRGMEAMDGPINFGERDAWWGLQTKGFQQPLYRMNYNPPYYIQLFENYGFQTYFEQLCYSLDVRNRLQDKFYEKHNIISQDPNFKAIHYSKAQLQKFATDIMIVYNKAWAQHLGNKQAEKHTIVKMLKSMHMVVDEKLIWVAYHKNDPIAFWINLPDINQYFQDFDGKLGIVEKIRLLWMKTFGKIDRFTGLVFGVVPEFQGQGIDDYLIVEAAKVIQGQKLYDRFEMQWVGDWNPKMVHVAESLGTTLSRKLKTYRYLFDREIEFKRHPFLS